MSDVAGWLKDLSLERYADTFAASEIDFDTLGSLTDADLRELGLPLGPRRKILSALHAPAEPAESGMETVGDAERRHITVLFADMVESTVIAARTDPEAMGELLKTYQRAVSKEIERHGGHVAKFMGDGVMAYFGWPLAQEDAAERSLRAGLGIVREVTQLTEASGAALHARIGIASGLVVIGEVVGSGSAKEESIAGDTPHLAARLQALADPDCVLIGEATHRLIGGLFACESKGVHTLKGFDRPIEVWRVREEAVGASRFSAVRATHSDFVGRESELELLDAGRVKAEGGAGSAIVISGEAGIGKSRLILALQERARESLGSRLVWQCSPYHGASALYPVMRRIESDAGFAADDSKAQKLDKLKALLGAARSDTPDTLSLIADLMSLPLEEGHPALLLAPAQRKAALIAAVTGWIANIAAREPQLLLLEDAHWIDPTTHELMTRLIATVASAPLLIVVTARPNFASPWNGRPHVTALTLDRLTLPQCRRVIAAEAGTRPLDPTIVDEIVAKSDGNPLFLEELTLGALGSSVRGGHVVPATLQDSLMARLDGLGEVKEIAQLAAVIGRRFSKPLLAELSPLGAAALEADISTLIAAEVVYPVAGTDAETYEFKHALIRDAAYESLLHAKRSRMHGAIARALEERFASVVETEPELLAHHFAQAGDGARASHYSESAGDRAAGRFAYAEAIASYRDALTQNALAPAGAERDLRELALLLKLGPALSIILGPQHVEVGQTYARAAEIARLADHLPDLFKSIWGLWYNGTIGRDLETAREHAEQLVILGERIGDDDHVLESIHCRWSTAMFRGEYPRAAADASKGIAIYDPARHHALAAIFGGHDPGVCAYGVHASANCISGSVDEGLRLADECVALAERLDHPHSLAHAFLNALIAYSCARDAQGAWGLSERMCELADKYNFPPQRSVGVFFLGWASAQGEEFESGLAGMEAEYPRVMALGPMPSFYTALLGDELIKAGRAGEALTILDRTLASLKFPTLGHYLPELHRVRGEALAALGPDHSEAARRALRKAVELANGQGARLFELRAAASLLRRASDDDRASSLDALATLYAGFTQGFDCPDLAEARQLLGWAADGAAP